MNKATERYQHSISLNIDEEKELQEILNDGLKLIDIFRKGIESLKNQKNTVVGG